MGSPQLREMQKSVLLFSQVTNVHLVAVVWPARLELLPVTWIEEAAGANEITTPENYVTLQNEIGLNQNGLYKDMLELNDYFCIQAYQPSEKFVIENEAKGQVRPWTQTRSNKSKTRVTNRIQRQNTASKSKKHTEIKLEAKDH